MRALKSVNPRRIRSRLDMNQADFWGRLGVTQSSGSLYETGRPMSTPVRILFGIVYLNEGAPPYKTPRPQLEKRRAKQSINGSRRA